MSQQESLKTVVRTLEELDIGYMVTGSIASSLQGEPRSTHDIDIVVNLPQKKAHALDAVPFASVVEIRLKRDLASHVRHVVAGVPANLPELAAAARQEF
ncbi:MAG: hypothetical protein HXY20_13410 [Acidobacteria bacterium]|nr:hypothetical protein [Acidobacteriota bacterium]